MSGSKIAYKISVSGVIFTLDSASINSDSPDTNLLALSLLGDFAEAQQRELMLDRNPASFKIIQDHLQGYRIFPLAEADYPGMNEAKMLRYLQDDSDYYNLNGLREEVNQELNRLSKAREAETKRLTAASTRLEAKETVLLDAERRKVASSNFQDRLARYKSSVEASNLVLSGLVNTFVSLESLDENARGFSDKQMTDFRKKVFSAIQNLAAEGDVIPPKL